LFYEFRSDPDSNGSVKILGILVVIQLVHCYTDSFFLPQMCRGEWGSSWWVGGIEIEWLEYSTVLQSSTIHEC